MAHSSKFHWQNLPIHMVPEHELKEQFNYDTKNPRREDNRIISTIDMRNDDQQQLLFIRYLEERIKFFERDPGTYCYIIRT